MKRNDRLEAWLDTATAGLSVESKRRVALLFLLVPRLYRRGRERVAIFLGAISDWALYVGLIVGSSLVLGDLSPVKTAFFLAIFAVILILYIPLLRKLRNRAPGTPHGATCRR